MAARTKRLAEEEEPRASQEYAQAEARRLKQLEVQAQDLSMRQLIEKFAKSVSQFGKELQCAVCLSLMSDPAKLPCSHAFCRGCLTQSLARKSKCPLCKASANRREVTADHKFGVILNQFRKIGLASSESSQNSSQEADNSQDESLFMSQAASVSQLTRKFDDGDYETEASNPATSSNRQVVPSTAPSKSFNVFRFLTTTQDEDEDTASEELERTQLVSQQRTPGSAKSSTQLLSNGSQNKDTPARIGLGRTPFEGSSRSTRTAAFVTPIGPKLSARFDSNSAKSKSGAASEEVDTPATVVLSPSVAAAWGRSTDGKGSREQSCPVDRDPDPSAIGGTELFPTTSSDRADEFLHRIDSPSLSSQAKSTSQLERVPNDDSLRDDGSQINSKAVSKIPNESMQFNTRSTLQDLEYRSKPSKTAFNSSVSQSESKQSVSQSESNKSVSQSESKKSVSQSESKKSVSQSKSNKSRSQSYTKNPDTQSESNKSTTKVNQPSTHANDKEIPQRTADKVSESNSKKKDDQNSLKNAEPAQPLQKFRKGECVTVARRMQPGMNKPGGVAMITKVNPDGTYNVKYPVSGGSERNLTPDLFSKGIDMNATSMSNVKAVSTSSQQDTTNTSSPRGNRRQANRSDESSESPIKQVDRVSGSTSAEKKRKSTEGAITKTKKKKLKVPQVPSSSISCLCKTSLQQEASVGTSLRGKHIRVAFEPWEVRDGVIEDWDNSTKKYIVLFAQDENNSDKEFVQLGKLDAHLIDHCTALGSSIDVDDFEDTTQSGSRSTTNLKQKKPTSRKRKSLELKQSNITSPRILVSMVDPSVVRKAVETLDGTTVADVLDDATHLVIKTKKSGENKRLASKRTVKYLQAIASGIWIVSQDWVKTSTKKGVWVDEEQFEVEGDHTTAKVEGISLTYPPKRARLTKTNSTSALLTGIRIVLCGTFGQSSPQDITLQLLIINAGGIVIQPQDLKELQEQRPNQGQVVAVCEKDLSSAKTDPDYELIRSMDIEDKLTLVGLPWLLNSIGSFKVQSTLPYRLIHRRR